MFSEEVEFYFREKFIDNKYLALYKKIVMKFLLNPVPRRKGHRHHIIPRSIVPGISDVKANIVCLGYTRPKMSEESKRKMSESQKKRWAKNGKRPKNFVIIVKSDKLRRERASRQSSGGNNPRAIPVIAYDDNGWEMHFSHYKAGAAFADTCRQSIRKVIDGDMKTAGKNPITKRKLKWRKK